MRRFLPYLHFKSRRYCTQTAITDPPAYPEFPEGVFPRRKVSSDHFYVTSPEQAQVIVSHLGDTKPNVPILEMNPGVGILTKHILERTKSIVHCLESQKVFKTQMEPLFMENLDRMTYSEGDLIKLDAKDSLEKGERVKAFLGPKRKNWSDDPCVKIVGGVGTPNYFKHLINSVIFQHPLFSHGRCEFLLFVTPSVLLRYICNERAGYFCYRPRAVLFQILFEYEILDLLPSKEFLPLVNQPKKNSKLVKLNELHSDSLYLVRMVPRHDLFSLCPPEHLYTLMFFVKQVMSSGKHRVIPYLEKWIDNCGVRIILESGTARPCPDPPPVVNGETFPDFVSQSRPLVVQGNPLPTMNISTEFGEISPVQIFQLFHEFVNWPEYNDSSFVSLMQQQYMKLTEKKEPGERPMRRRG